MMWCSNSFANGAEPLSKQPTHVEISVGMKGAGKSATAQSRRNSIAKTPETTGLFTVISESHDSASFAEKNFLLALEGKNSAMMTADAYTVETAGEGSMERW
jgi:hypothetical protein